MKYLTEGETLEALRDYEREARKRADALQRTVEDALEQIYKHDMKADWYKKQADELEKRIKRGHLRVVV